MGEIQCSMKLMRLFFIAMCVVSIASIRSFSVERKVITHSHEVTAHHEHDHHHEHAQNSAKANQEKPTEQNTEHTHTHDLAIASIGLPYDVPQSTALQKIDTGHVKNSAFRANQPPSPMLDPLFRPPIT
jgi:hypothetical protein